MGAYFCNPDPSALLTERFVVVVLLEAREGFRT